MEITVVLTFSGESHRSRTEIGRGTHTFSGLELDSGKAGRR